MGIEYLTVLFPTEVSSFDFQVENSGSTIQYQQSLRLFGLHSDVNDAHRAGANRLQQFLSQGRAMRSALVKRLYCAVCAAFMGVLSTLPVDFLEFFPGNRNHHHFSDDVGCHELQLVCHCEVGHCEVEDEYEDVAGGFPRDSL